MKWIRPLTGHAACARKEGAGNPDAAAEARIRMVREQLESREISDPRVLAAMRRVPRHRFVPVDRIDRACDDRPLPVGFGQTISQPYVVAFMSEACGLTPEDRVLEVGTGSGYQTAVLAELAGEVYSVEIVEPLGRRARETLERTGYGRVHTGIGNGYRGWPEAAPFDAIVITCAPERIPEPLVDQLADGGRMVLPVGPAGHPQRLVLLHRHGREIRTQNLLAVAFVPMIREVPERPEAGGGRHPEDGPGEPPE